MLILLSCKNTEQNKSTQNDTFELLPEPDKDLREAYEKHIADSILKHYPLKVDVTDSIQITPSLKQDDEIVNEYLFEDLKPIRKNFKRINSIEKWSSTKTIDIWETTEGGQATYYYSDNGLEKIIVRHFGETFQRIEEYYLLDRKLSFVFEKSFNYNRPILYDSIAMKENNDNQVWDFDTSEIIEERSYFKNRKLLHQLINLDCGSPFAEDYLKEEGNRVLTQFDTYIKLKNKKQ